MSTHSGRVKLVLAVALAVVGGQLLGGCSEPSGAPAPEAGTDREVQRVEYDSPEVVGELFDQLGYTPEAWQAGIREVPRVFLTTIPNRWRETRSKEIPVVLKKQTFFRILGPLVLRANELILADRERASAAVAALREGSALPAGDRTFLVETAAAYKLSDPDAVVSDPAAQAELLARLDAVPPSLVLAQGAEESGWGTSRFAAQGNALFGQWTWGGDGITPLQQRSELGNYKIAAYETPLQSVVAYMHNLNTHPAYRGLRERRAELRRAGEPVTGWDLAETLTSYSERGQEYVDSLHAIMRVNVLRPTDDAFLGDGPTILLVPVGAGV